MDITSTPVATCDYEQCQGIQDHMVEDESGTYHETCYQEMTRAEAAYWQRHFAQKFTDIEPVDESLAYEPTDPKNAVYVERLLDAIDAAIEH